MSTTEETPLEQLLVRCRDAFESLPIDALGEGSTVVTAPDGESGEIRWPIRDELVDALNRALAPLQESEPRLWDVTRSDGLVRWITRDPEQAADYRDLGHTVEPLFASPRPGEVVDGSCICGARRS